MTLLGRSYSKGRLPRRLQATILTRAFRRGGTAPPAGISGNDAALRRRGAVL
jgi:hypothetical protein